jgi:hypothetical protein
VFVAWRCNAWDLTLNQFKLLLLACVILFAFQMLVVFQVASARLVTLLPSLQPGSWTIALEK